MARINNLTNFLTDVASAIKQKTGKSASLPAADFDTEILSIETGGNYQTKSININTSGNYNLLPDTGYDAMTEVTISVAISPNLQDLTLTQNGTYTAGQGYDGIGEVIVNVPGAENLNAVLTAQEQKLAELEALVDSKIAGLDSAYKELEYIESSGTQYIDTGFIGDQNTRIYTEIRLSNIEAAQVHSIFGSLTSSGTRHFGITIGSNKVWNTGYGDTNYYDNNRTASSNTRYVLDKNQNIVYIDDSLFATQSQSEFICPSTILIFGIHLGSTPTFLTAMRLYEFRVYDNGTLVRNFIPVKRRSDNEVGLYDKVTKQFFTNQGTGSFVAGPEI